MEPFHSAEGKIKDNESPSEHAETITTVLGDAASDTQENIDRPSHKSLELCMKQKQTINANYSHLQHKWDSRLKQLSAFEWGFGFRPDRATLAKTIRETLGRSFKIGIFHPRFTQIPRQPVISRTAKQLGITIVTSQQDEFDIAWFSGLKDVRDVFYRKMIIPFPHRVVNRIPRCREALLKSNFTNLLNLYTKINNDLAPVHPPSWVDGLPSNKKDDRYYITKPYAAHGGVGIQLWLGQDLSHPSYIQRQVVQEYIDNPLLVDGLKFDMRLYVVVLSLNPLRAYLYRDGLVRFCTVRYASPTDANHSNVLMHLTNYHLNKDSKFFVSDKSSGYNPDVVLSRGGHQFAYLSAAHSNMQHNTCNSDVHSTDHTQNLSSFESSDGSNDTLLNTYSKQNLLHVWTRLAEAGHDVQFLQNRLRECVSHTLVAISGMLLMNYDAVLSSCLCSDLNYPRISQILGFDVMFDAHGKPWVLEVNNNPSLLCETDIDWVIKAPLVQQYVGFLHACVASTINDRQVQPTQNKPEQGDMKLRQNKEQLKPIVPRFRWKCTRIQIADAAPIPKNHTTSEANSLANEKEGFFFLGHRQDKSEMPYQRMCHLNINTANDSCKLYECDVTTKQSLELSPVHFECLSDIVSFAQLRNPFHGSIPSHLFRLLAKPCDQHQCALLLSGLAIPCQTFMDVARLAAPALTRIRQTCRVLHASCQQLPPASFNNCPHSDEKLDATLSGHYQERNSKTCKSKLHLTEPEFLPNLDTSAMCEDEGEIAVLRDEILALCEKQQQRVSWCSFPLFCQLVVELADLIREREAPDRSIPSRTTIITDTLSALHAVTLSTESLKVDEQK